MLTPSGQLVWSEYRFLVVDSDPESCLQNGGVLAELGASVDVAGSGAEGVLLLRQDTSFAAIFVALRLTDMNGVEFIERVQQLPRPTPVILMLEFGWDPGPMLAKARAAGLARGATVCKPLVARQLEAALSTVLQNSSP